MREGSLPWRQLCAVWPIATTATIFLCLAITTGHAKGDYELVAQGGLVDNPMKVGPRRVPDYVVDECNKYFARIGRSDESAQIECLAAMGFPAKRNYVVPSCNLATACLSFPDSTWDDVVRRVEDADITIRHATHFRFEPKSGDKNSTYKLIAHAVVDLSHLQANLPHFVSLALPDNSCEQHTKSTGHGERIDGDAYVFTMRLRTDIRACGLGIHDVGSFNSRIEVRLHASVDDGELVLRSDVSYHPGPKPHLVKLVEELERVGNAITGQIFRMGLGRQFDEQIKNAVDEAANASQDLIREKVDVPGMAAFKARVEKASMFLYKNRLFLGIPASAEIPAAAVCDLQAEIAKVNKPVCR